MAIATTNSDNKQFANGFTNIQWPVQPVYPQNYTVNAFGQAIPANFVQSTPKTQAQQRYNSPQVKPSNVELKKPQSISYSEPRKKFSPVDTSDPELAANIKDIAQSFKGKLFINASKDRLIVSQSGEDIKNALFERGIWASIKNFFRSIFGGQRTDIGLEHYKKLFWSPGTHSGESPEQLLSNMTHAAGKEGGHYYGQVSFKLNKNKFVPDTVTITDSAHYAEESLMEAGVINDKTDYHKKDYLIKYIIPINADLKTYKMSERTAEIIDVLMNHQANDFDTFYIVGSPKESELAKSHSFKSIPWHFPLKGDDGKWTHHPGHLFVVKRRGKPVSFLPNTAEVLAEMQTTLGERHADMEFFYKCLEKNRHSLNLK